MDTALLIFDCDGVLIDSEAIYIEVELAFLEGKGVHVDRQWYVGAFMALAQPLWKQKLSDLLEEHTGSPLSEDDYAALKADSRAQVLANLRTIAGIETLLGRLAIPACVASSTQMHLLPNKLERAGLLDFFGEAVFSGDMVENGKPAPDLFLHAASVMGVEPARCIVVEDSANGVHGAKAAGMFTIGFTGGGHAGPGHDGQLIAAGADHVAASHDDLAHWLEANTNALKAV